MILFQLTGLSGAGKTTLAYSVKEALTQMGYLFEVIDGDAYRSNLCRDLGFTKADRMTNIRRLSYVAKALVNNKINVIISAINPYEEVRKEVSHQFMFCKTIWINCDLDTLMQRDTKGLYKRAGLPDTDSQKIFNLSGVNDVFEEPVMPDLVVNTHLESIEESKNKLLQFIIEEFERHNIVPNAIIAAKNKHL